MTLLVRPEVVAGVSGIPALHHLQLVSAGLMADELTVRIYNNNNNNKSLFQTQSPYTT